MLANEKTILVVDSDAGSAESLRELIEFMDTPVVTVAAPADWRERLGKRRLEALFVGPGLSDRQVAGLFNALADIDPNVPVVMLHGGSP
jgi:DNA-binding NtrC family response regulator